MYLNECIDRRKYIIFCIKLQHKIWNWLIGLNCSISIIIEELVLNSFLQKPLVTSESGVCVEPLHCTLVPLTIQFDVYCISSERGYWCFGDQSIAIYSFMVRVLLFISSLHPCNRKLLFRYKVFLSWLDKFLLMFMFGMFCGTFI